MNKDGAGLDNFSEEQHAVQDKQVIGEQLMNLLKKVVDHLEMTRLSSPFSQHKVHLTSTRIGPLFCINCLD